MCWNHCLQGTEGIGRSSWWGSLASYLPVLLTLTFPPLLGQTVAIVGAGGGLGSLACQFAKAMGLRVIAIDAGDEKKEMTSKLGAEAFVDFSKSSNVVKDVQASTEDGMGPHAVLLVAVSEKPFQQATEASQFSKTLSALAKIE